MNNQDSIGFWKSIVSKPNLESKDTKFGNSDSSIYDCNFILQYADEKSEILDLGSGGGLIVNKLYDKVKNIICVELFEELSQFIVKSPNISVVNKNLFDYQPRQNEKFDLITVFGVLSYFNEQETLKLCNKYIKYLKTGGKIIIKQQFGVNETVTIQNFSKELNGFYFAQYRTLEQEQEMLRQAGFEILEITDIYPPEHNKWENTHYFAIVATKLP